MYKLKELEMKFDAFYPKALTCILKHILLLGLFNITLVLTMIYQPEGLIYAGYALMISFLILGLKHFIRALFAVFALVVTKIYFTAQKNG